MQEMTTKVSHTPKSLRVRLGISQAQLAKLASKGGGRVSPRTICSLETGADVSLDTLRLVARALKVQCQDLIDAIDFERARRKGSAA